MIERCKTDEPKVRRRYKARGITVCRRWRMNYRQFLADMGRAPSPKHTLDRRNNSLGYSPSNCRWATMLEQQNNRANNRLLTLKGVRLTLAQWAALLCVAYESIRSRLNRGWSVRACLTIPMRPKQLPESRTWDDNYPPHLWYI